MVDRGSTGASGRSVGGCHLVILAYAHSGRCWTTTHPAYRSALCGHRSELRDFHLQRRSTSQTSRMWLSSVIKRRSSRRGGHPTSTLVRGTSEPRGSPSGDDGANCLSLTRIPCLTAGCLCFCSWKGKHHDHAFLSPSPRITTLLRLVEPQFEAQVMLKRNRK